MKYVMLCAWTVSCCAFDDFGKEWIEKWKHIKADLESSGIQHIASHKEEQNICSLVDSFEVVKQRPQYKPEVSISVFDKQASVSGALGFLAVIFDWLRAAKRNRMHKDMVLGMSYDEFLRDYPEYVPLEYQILRVQKLLKMSKYGTFSEQVFARIELAQTSLCTPYEKAFLKSVKKLLKHSFDKQGKFVWNENLDVQSLFNAFYKKVPQNWKAILCDEKKLPKGMNSLRSNEHVKHEYVQHEYVKYEYIRRLQNEYNQTLIDMVYEGIAQNFPRLKQLCRKYFDNLVQKLYDYQIEQRYKRRERLYAQHDPFYKNDQSNTHQEECVLRDYYQQELVTWLCGQDSGFEAGNILYDVIGDGKQVLELPLDKEYLFTLLRRFIDMTCHGQETDQELYELFFDQSGILKKYQHDPYVQTYFQTIQLTDELLHKAVNFALAIKEKEQDIVVQKVAQLLLHYVVLAYEQVETFLLHKEKIKRLYKALSCNQYDATIFQI